MLFTFGFSSTSSSSWNWFWWFLLFGFGTTVIRSRTVAGAETCGQTYNATAFYETISYRMAESSGIAYSPDGLYLLITSDQTGVFNAYALPIIGMNSNTTTNTTNVTSTTNGTDTDSTTTIIALTNSTTNAISAISYFPLDARILYSADEGGNELDHIYVRSSTSSGDDGSSIVQDLTPGDNVKAFFGGWRDDGQAFFILTNERNASFFDVYEYSTTAATDEGDEEEDESPYSRSLIFQNDLAYEIAAISPDARWLATVQLRSSEDSNIILVDLLPPPENVEESSGNETMLITEHDGNVAHGVQTFTRDSSALIYTTNEFGEYSQAWMYNLTTGEKSPVVQADWDVTFVFYSPSGRYRISGINADAISEITIVDTYSNTSNATLELPWSELPAGDLGQFRFSANEDTLAFVIDSDTTPSDIFVISLGVNSSLQQGDDEQGDEEEDDADTSIDVLQLTNALNADICPEDLVDGQVIRYPSFDALEIPSILYRPKSASADNRVPALVWVHGGPGGQSTKGYDATKQHLLNHGYAILAANNRGSSGYGKTFYHMDDQRHGEVDLQDIVYGKKYLESLDWVDPNRIGIIGGSYGGYMTVAALAFEPDVFEVGIDIFGVTNWLRTLESIPPWWAAAKEALYDEMGDPFDPETEERLRRISPLFHADQITKPLMVVQGANDPRVLQVESDEIVAALRNNSIPVEYLVFEDEGHGFKVKSNRIEASEAFLAFLTKYLTGVETNATKPTDETSTSTTTTSGANDVVASFSALSIQCIFLAMFGAQMFIL